MCILNELVLHRAADLRRYAALLAALLVVASCEVDPLPTSLAELVTSQGEPTAGPMEPAASQVETAASSSGGTSETSAAPVFSELNGRPELRNQSEVVQALRREYPRALREADIAGQAVVWFYVTQTGRVRDRRLARSSGHAQLDEAALRVGDVFRFTPAYTPEGPVAVWIQVPITFSGI